MSAEAQLAGFPAPPPDRVGWPWKMASPQPDPHAAPARGWPKISIICPSFQQGKFIEETIRSVLLQNYPALEFIVVDGGSRDGTIAVLEKYSRWITHWISEADRGQAHALNKGFARASGEIFGWINSDDYYLPGAFAAVGGAMKTNRKELLYGDHERLDEAANKRELVRMPRVFAFEIYAGGFTLPSHATFWTARAHLPFDESLQFIMDADLFKRVAAAGARIRRIDAALGVFRLHESAKTATLQSRGRLETEQWLARHPRWHWWILWQSHRLLMRLRRFFQRA